MRGSFRNRLLLAFATIGLAPLMLTGGLILWHSYSSHVQESSARQLELAKKVADQVTGLLNSSERDLTLLVKFAGHTGEPEAIRPLLERLLTERRTYREIALLDAAGEERLRVSNIRLVDRPPPPPDTGLPARVATGSTYFSPVYHDPTSGEPLMGVAAPVMSPRTGGLLAVVLAEIRVRAIWDLLAQQRWQPGEEGFIIDEAGLIIAHINPSVVLSGATAGPAVEPVWRRGLSGDTVLAVGHGVMLNNREFHVVVERTLRAALQPALEALALLTGVMTLSLLLAGGLFLTAVRSVVRPVQAVSLVAQAVQDGNLDRRAEILSNDEIGQLAATFNDMTARLRRVLGDLRVEVEERRQAEERLIRINNAYQALSGCSTLLSSAGREDDILTGVCRIVIDDCHYRLVWIGLIDQGVAIVPVASAGFDAGYLDGFSLDLHDPDTMRGPAATACREKRVVVVDDVQQDPCFIPWRARAGRHGFQSLAAVPLLAGNCAIGVLTVYSEQVAAFNAEETRLLGELAANVGHGLVSLRLRQQTRQAEAALRHSEARLRQVTNALPALLWTWGDGGTSYFNARWCAYTGLSEAQSLGDGWHQAVHPEDLPQVLRTWQEALASNQLFGLEARLRRHDGVYRWFLVQAEPVDGRTADALWVGTCTDIEDRKRGEAQLIQTSKLATLGEMAAGLAHEMGQPLNIIRMNADIAEMRLQSGAPDCQSLAGTLAQISHQTERMGQLIEHMRVFSRDDNLLQEVFDLGAVVEGVAGLLASQFRFQGITLDVQRDAGPLPVLGNRVQLEQVVLNLLTNARDALEGRSAADEPGVWIAVARGGDGLTAVTRVRDNGPGIAPAILDRIFEPFVTSKTAARGTGLGLAICLRIVTQMKGTLEARNLSRGAEFTVTLPTTSQAARPDMAAPAAAATASRKRVLVVDDESAATDILGQFLADMGYEVTVACSGTEAAELFRARPADIVVTDITMPSGDGLDLLSRLRAVAPGLPAVVVTGRIDAAGLLAADLAAGRSRLLRKPVSIRDLSAVLADLLGQRG